MTTNYQQLPLAQVLPGMSLSDELLDVQGHVLLPQGTVLSEAMIALMPRHGIAVLPIALQPVSAEQLAAEREQRLERIAHLFRKNDPEAEQDWATALLRSHVSHFRAGAPGEPA
ncbi:hypothetical protein [Rugamonas rubra]|jgi:hypothetical protein|uniref:Uncharacterized protein n=1 Tax=Rugamonas rubra TaxID=758825 RepID=A0A1I4HYX0_9BURK|nr:hypothetical protein [Rugamonas rubra]SFL47338.1 hypothetical protein SAMN02982985_00330 [Rugamonas rubra]